MSVLNIERLTILADTLESMAKEDRRFDMNTFYEGKAMEGGKGTGEKNITPSHLKKNSCGTSACIAGHAVAMFRGHRSPFHINNTGAIAARLLGLNEKQENELFYNAWHVTDPKKGAQAIRNLIADPESDPWLGAT